MANQWTLTTSRGALTVLWPASKPFQMQAAVVGMSERVIGRPRPVFRHFAGNVTFTVHHLLRDMTNADTWDTMFGAAYDLQLMLTGAPLFVDFVCELTGPDGYSQSVRIVNVTIESPQPPFAKTFSLAIELEEINY